MITVFIAIGLVFYFIVKPYSELTSLERNKSGELRIEPKPSVDIIERYQPDLNIVLTDAKVDGTSLKLKWRAKNTDVYNNIATVCLYGYDLKGRELSTLTPKNKKALMGDMGACGYTSSGEHMPLLLGDVAVATGTEEIDISDSANRFAEPPAYYKVEILVLDGRAETTNWAGLVASDIYDGVLEVR